MSCSHGTARHGLPLTTRLKNFGMSSRMAWPCPYGTARPAHCQEPSKAGPSRRGTFPTISYYKKPARAPSRHPPLPLLRPSRPHPHHRPHTPHGFIPKFWNDLPSTPIRTTSRPHGRPQPHSWPNLTHKRAGPGRSATHCPHCPHLTFYRQATRKVRLMVPPCPTVRNA